MSDRMSETDHPTEMTTCAVPLHMAKLLLIDGEDGTRFRVASDLKQAGASVVLASHGEAALICVCEAQDAGEPYDLVVVDLSTLGKDGYEAAACLRDADFAGPILALTNRSMVREGNLSAEVGCDDLIQKSDDPSAMIDSASSLVNREKARRFGLAQPEDVTSELAGYPELMMMLRRFVSNLPDAVESVLGAQREQDIARLQEELDQIKRGATSHGYLSIRASAVSASRELENSKKPDEGAVVQAVEDLIDLCRRATVSPQAPPPPSGPPLPPSG